MRTIADFKRRLTKGAKIHTMYHQASAGRDEQGQIILKDEDRGIRTVNIIQSNSFTLLTEDRNNPGKVIDSWMNYPRKDEAIFLNDDSIQILTPDFRERNSTKLIPCVTYTFIH